MAVIAEGIKSGDRNEMLRVALACATTRPVNDVLGRSVKGEASECYSGGKSGWVLIALQNAFLQLQRDATVEDGLAATVGKGGDTDTNAAIAGALLGAVPRRWVMPVQACRPHADLGALNPRQMTCWPDDLATLAEALLTARPAPPAPAAPT